MRFFVLLMYVYMTFSSLLTKFIIFILANFYLIIFRKPLLDSVGQNTGGKNSVPDLLPPDIPWSQGTNYNIKKKY